MIGTIPFEFQFDKWVEINNGRVIYRDDSKHFVIIKFPNGKECEDCIVGLKRLISMWFDRKMHIVRDTPTQISVTTE